MFSIIRFKYDKAEENSNLFCTASAKVGHEDDTAAVLRCTLSVDLGLVASTGPMRGREARQVSIG